MQSLDITIVGAGVVGLAVAYELSRSYQDVLAIEKNRSFGEETSSRNSEVIHAGIYYPGDSLKAKTCIEGNRLVYEFCQECKIPHKKTGKLIVALNKDELIGLRGLFRQGIENGAQGLRIIDKSELKKIEPNVLAEAAIFSPSTGILDTHAFMKALETQIKDNHGTIAYNTEVIAIEKRKGGFEVAVKDNSEGEFKFFTRILINAAGLNSDKVCEMAGLKKREYRLKYCKGDYFRVLGHKAKFINRLVYPLPREHAAGLGVHATLDLSGGMRLGPDDEYVDRIDYDINPAKRGVFYDSVRKFLPFIEEADINPDTSGIRPKLQGPGEGFRDFVIKEESDNGFSGLIDLIGIESPGFTAALSIGKMVSAIASSVKEEVANG